MLQELSSSKIYSEIYVKGVCYMAFMKVLGGGVVDSQDQWGASCLFLSINGINIVVDCGVRLNTGVDPLPDLKKIANERVDAIFITHAHTDHVGAAPLIAAQHPEAQIFMTFHTATISELLLAGNLDVAERYKKPVAYNRKDCGQLFQKTMIAEFENWQTIERGGNKIEFCFWPAGHIRGAASILIKGGNDDRYLFTGDISLHSMPTVDAAKEVPTSFVNDKLVMVTEATNGSVVLPNRIDEECRLVEKIHEVNARGGHVLLPAFAVGRSQDVALFLAKAGIKVWLGGMAKKILSSDAFGRDFFHPNIRKFYGGDMDFVADSEYPEVIVTTPGMMEGGQSLELAYRWMEDPQNAIFFVGYQAPGTMGNKIRNAPAGSFIHFLEKELRKEPHLRRLNAEIESFQLSAHTDGVQLANWIQYLNPKHTYIVHAEKSSAESLVNRLWSQDMRKPIEPALNGGIYDL